MNASRDTKLRLRWLPANSCWGFVLGRDQLTSVDGRTLYRHKGDAVAAAERCGLRVLAGGIVEADEPALWVLG